MADTVGILARYQREAGMAVILTRYRREGDTADTANILAQYRHEGDTSSAEAARNSAAAHPEDIVTGAAETGAAATGAAATGAAVTGAAETGAAVTDSSLSADLVTRTTGVGIHIGVGAILTRTAAIILIRTILRTGTIMIITIALYQEGDSLAPKPSVILFNNQSSCFTGVGGGSLFYHSLNSPACSCVWITLPASSQTRITAPCKRLRNFA